MDKKSFSTSHSRRRLHVFGDSHAAACFDRFTDADIYHQGPVTMHRIARDGLFFLSERFPDCAQFDLVIFVFGEIDVRCHLGRIADSSGKAREALTHNLARTFATKISDAMRGRPGQVVLCSVVPASEFSGDPKYPTYGTLDDRIAITSMLNQALEAAALEFDFVFLNFEKLYADRRGCLRRSTSDGTVHIGLNHTLPIRNELARKIGSPVRYRWDIWLRSLVLRPAELFISSIRPQALWRFNRDYVNVRQKVQY